MKRESKSVKVVCGEFSARYKELVGKNIAAAKEFLQGKVELADGMVAVFENDVLEDKDELRAGETVEFKMPLVTVACGANEVKEAKLIGKTVAYVRKTMKDVLNIPKDADASLDGEPIKRAEEKSVMLAAFEKLEFIKEDGQKG